MSRFRQIKDGEPITLEYMQTSKTKYAVHNFACCDCGLVHKIGYVPLKTRLKIYCWRDNRRTANHRRAKRGEK